MDQENLNVLDTNHAIAVGRYAIVSGYMNWGPVKSIAWAMLLAIVVFPTAPSGAETLSVATGEVRADLSHSGCDMPECARESLCPTMPMSDCGMNASCSVCGAGVLMHYASGFWFERSTNVSWNDAHGLRIQQLYDRIFHPPRVS